jgi:tetratricopeptide (TPR) repeat protein
VIDDEKLQDLLTRASSLYNNGEYKGAIDAWTEALSVDPQSQKAREGIRMATLLIGDFDSTPAGVPEEAPAPADGAETAPEDLPAEEAEARLELGIAHVKQLLAERRHAEAIEGAQGLLPLDPNSPDLLALLEQAQHAFESAPFIEEHITLARELLAQERYAEAEVECKKIFTLDATHPGGKQLLKEIRDEIQKSLKAAANQLGGMTVKLSMSDVLKAGPKPKAPPAPAPAPAPPTEEPAATEIPEMDGGPNSFEYGDQAIVQEDVAARAALEAAFTDPAQGSVTEESPFELAGGEPPTAAAESNLPGPANTIEETVVEAKTVRPPSSRVVPRVPPSTEEPVATAPTGPVVPPPVVTGPAKAKSAESPAPAKPAAKPAPAGAAKPGPAAKPAADGAHAAIPVADPGAHDEASAWEAELAQLNLKEKERGILRGTGAKAVGATADSGDVDLMSLLDNGSMPGMEGPEGDKTAASPPSVPLAHAKEAVKPAKPAEETKKSRHHAASTGEAPAEAPAVAPKLRAAERPRPVAARAKRGSSFFKILLLLLVLGGGGAAAWVFYIQPRFLGGAGQPGQPVAPPAGSPAGTLDASQGPIPTPIGGSSRQQPAPSQGADGAGVAAPSGPAAAGAAPGTVGANPAGTSAPATAPSNEPIKPPAAPALSPEEARRKIASFTADGRRLVGEGKWREARAKLTAVLALDPANIEVKELLDRAQAKIDDEQKLQDEFDSVKSLMAEKDYENTLRKLYRLPRDKGLGDIDLYIRNAWFNWAVTLMKAGNSRDALQKLSECLTVDPDDAQALKLQEVAEKYTARAKDRVYYAFADGLVLRELGQK